MPLERLPDCFDGPTHDELDKAVNKTALANMAPDPGIVALLLVYIVRHSKDCLDPKYRSLEESETLIEGHEELGDMLLSAWNCKSYREIRNLAILRKPSAVPTTFDKEPEMIYVGLSKSFTAKFHGAAVEGFHEYLAENESLFKDEQGPAYYAKLCSIVQSSGTGKSRLLTEYYKKDVVVLYMNICEETDVRGFPARDSIPANILTKFPPSRAAYQLVCYAFFTALFEALDEKLRDTKETVMEWAKQMCDVEYVPKHTARSNFFGIMLEKYNKIHPELVRLANKCLNVETNPSPCDVDRAVEELSLLNTPFSLFSRVYHNVGAALKRIFPGDSGRPRVVIAIDEAYPLTPTETDGVGGYRPANVLCRIISRYSHDADYPIWVVFASMASKVVDFAPPNEKHDSERGANEGLQLFPPYTQLGWDQNAKAPGDVDLEDVSKLGHIASYGRPLWRSLMTALNVPSEVLRTASWKLCGSSSFEAKNIDHVLAVLGQRFAVNVTFGHPDSVAFLETAVASHLRICIGTTPDRRWWWTNYPSEPLLSCVAAGNLHASPNNLGSALDVLLGAIKRGMIDMGRQGELASRLLWLLAKDLYVRASAPKQRHGPLSWNEDIMDCKMIPVVDWLEFIFGSQIWEKKDPQVSEAQKKFENAYLNFSHWVAMGAIFTSKDGNELDLNELTLRHWQRTSAVQCCHLQPLIDKVIPIYFKADSGTALARSRMSYILISDKTSQSKSSKCSLSKITRRSEHLTRYDKDGIDHDTNSLPYIAILADLGRQPSFSLTFPARDADDPCLRIYAAGVDTSTYPFLVKHPKLMDALQTLVRLQQMPETKKPYTEYLNAQVKFGSTATAQHMHWEHGKAIPNLAGEPAQQSDEDEDQSGFNTT